MSPPTSYLTRIVEFTASHTIRRPDWSDERNRAEFGKAAHAHPHRYELRVTVKGPLEPAAGGAVSLPALDRLLSEEVTARFDDRDINRDVPEFAEGRWLPTGEALAVYFWQRLAGRLPPGVALHAVRVQEGAHLYSEYFGDA